MGKLSVTRFDAAAYLKSDEDIVAFLNAAAEGGDAAHYARALGIAARARNQMVGLAKETGLTRQGLHKAFSGDGRTSLETTMRVMSAMGMTFHVAAKDKPANAAKVNKSRMSSGAFVTVEKSQKVVARPRLKRA